MTTLYLHYSTPPFIPHSFCVPWLPLKFMTLYMCVCRCIHVYISVYISVEFTLELFFLNVVCSSYKCKSKDNVLLEKFVSLQSSSQGTVVEWPFLPMKHSSRIHVAGCKFLLLNTMIQGRIFHCFTLLTLLSDLPVMSQSLNLTWSSKAVSLSGLPNNEPIKALFDFEDSLWLRIKLNIWSAI